MVKESLTFVSGSSNQGYGNSCRARRITWTPSCLTNHLETTSALRDCMGIGMTFYMPAEFCPFSLGIYKLDVKVEEERWDQLRHFHPAQICSLVSYFFNTRICQEKLLIYFYPDTLEGLDVSARVAGNTLGVFCSFDWSEILLQ